MFVVDTMVEKKFYIICDFFFPFFQESHKRTIENSVRGRIQDCKAACFTRRGHLFR